MLTFGPDANSGTLVGRVGAGAAQTLGFANMESVADTSTAASLTIVGNDASNVIELTAGPLAGGVTPTGTVRVSDVAGATPAPVPPPTPSPPTPGPTTPSTPAALSKDEKREAKRLAEEAKKEAKRLAKEAKKEAKRLAKEAKRLAHEKKRAESHARRRKTASPVPAATAAIAAAEPLSIARAYLPFHFANKIAVTIDAKGGDDLLDVNVVGSVPAGLQTLTLDGGAGSDRLARQSAPAGVPVQELNLESTSATREFASAAVAPAVVEPPIPAAPPPTPASAGDEEDDDDDEDKKGKDEKKHKDDRDNDDESDEDSDDED